MQQTCQIKDLGFKIVDLKLRNLGIQEFVNSRIRKLENSLKLQNRG